MTAPAPLQDAVEFVASLGRKPQPQAAQILLDRYHSSDADFREEIVLALFAAYRIARASFTDARVPVAGFAT